MARPTQYRARFAEEAKKLCLLGADDKALADFFDVSVATISTWKHKHPKFLEALKQGKHQKDAKVERSLLERALGYSCPEEKVFCHDGVVVTHETTKHYPPDVTACIFWLKNRQPEKWRDKRDVECTGDLKVIVTNYGDDDNTAA